MRQQQRERRHAVMAKPGWMANSVGFYGASGMTGLESPSRNKMNHSGPSPEGKVSEII